MVTARTALRRRVPGVAAAVALAIAACRVSTGPASHPTHPTGDSLVTVVLGNRPYGVAISSPGTAWVTQFGLNTIAVVDLTTDQIASRFLVGNGPLDLAFAPGTSGAWVTNYSDLNVGVINGATAAQTTTWPLAALPFRLVLAPSGEKLYVTMNNGALAVLNAGTGTLRTTLPIGILPNGLSFGSGGARLYVSDYINGTLVEVDASADAVTGSVRIGDNPQEVRVAPGDSMLFVAYEPGWVGVWNVNGWTRRDSIPLPGPGAFALAMTPDQTQLWVTSSASGAVNVIDIATLTVVKTIAVGGTPKRIAFTADGRTAVVANEAGSVQIIR